MDLPGEAALPTAELAAVASAASGHDVSDPVACAAPVAYDWGSPATAGLWRVDVREGSPDGQVACSFFVKLLRDIRLWPGLASIPAALRADFTEFYPWRYELDMYECGIGSVLPDGMRTPVLHHVKYADADHIALWWEFIIQRRGQWARPDYERAAYLLGRLAARRREGAPVNEKLPARAHDQSRGSSLRRYTETRVLLGLLPALRAGAVWGHPVVAEALSRTRDPGLPAAMLALGERLPKLIDVLEGLPQTHAHGDASPQNLLLPADEPGTIAAIDWGFGDLLPVGFDLGQLLAGLAHAGETDPADLAGIDAVIFPSYLEGLAAEGYDVAPQDVRTGYIGGLAARSALCTLPLEMLGSATPDQEETVALFADRLRLARVLVDMAAEVS
jgi:hypothetical protein